MIKINLLPQELAGGRGGGRSTESAGSALVALVLIVIFAVDLALAGWLFAQYSASESRNKAAVARMAALDKELKEQETLYNNQKMSLDRMQNLIAVAESLDPADRLLWSRKLNMLPLLTPEGVFLTSIDVTRVIREVETEASVKARNEWEKKRQGTPPPVQRNPVIHQVLTLDGVSHVDQGNPNARLDQITAFFRNLQSRQVTLPFRKETRSFMEGFMPTIDPSPVSSTTIEGREVSRFKFTMRTKSTTIKQ